MCKDRHAVLGWVNFGLAISCCIYGFFSLLHIGKTPTVINYLFPIYYMLFGFIMFMSFCKWQFITDQYLFLRVTTGRGLFNIL